MNTNGNRIIGYSYIRVLSCLAIVLLHGFFLAASYVSQETSDYTLAMSVRNVFLWAVPCFVMVSGALLLNPAKNMTFVKLFKKYILKVVIALVVFTIINAAYSSIVDKIGFGATVKIIGVNLITGTGWPHMWYLYMLIAMYLTLPILRIFVKHADLKVMNYTMAVMFIVLSIIPCIATFNELSSGIYLWTNTIYPLYFLAGYYIVNYRIGVKKLPAVGLFILCQVLLVVMTIMGKNSIISTYNFPLVVIPSALVFMLIRDAKSKSGKIESIILSIDKSTFGIYLLHLIVLRTLFLIHNPFAGRLSWLVVIGYSIAAFLVSWGLDLVYRKVRFLIK